MVDLIAFLDTISPEVILIAIILIFILQSPLLTFPGWALMTYSGISLGWLHGGLTAYIGIFSSCIIGYRFGHWSSLDMDRMDNKYVTRYNKWIQKHGEKAVLLFRIFPIIPYNVTSIASGFSKIDEKKHFVYSMLFTLPWAFFWAILGDKFAAKYFYNIQLTITVWHGLLAGVILAAMFGLKKIQKRQKKKNKV